MAFQCTRETIEQHIIRTPGHRTCQQRLTGHAHKGQVRHTIPAGDDDAADEHGRSRPLNICRCLSTSGISWRGAILLQRQPSFSSLILVGRPSCRDAYRGINISWHERCGNATDYVTENSTGFCLLLPCTCASTSQSIRIWSGAFDDAACSQLDARCYLVPGTQQLWSVVRRWNLLLVSPVRLTGGFLEVVSSCRYRL